MIIPAFRASALTVLSLCIAALAVVGCRASETVSPRISLAVAADEPPREDIGSSRNSRVAFVMPPHERVPLVFLAGDVSQTELETLSKEAPNLRIISGLNRQSALQHAAEAHGCDTRVLSEELLKRADKLVWIQALSAGVDRYMRLQPLVDNDRILLTNMRGVHGPAIAEHAMAMLLSLTRNLRHYDAAQREGRWTSDDPPVRSIALEGRTLLIVGLGGIGSEVAQRAYSFGMRVIATRRSDAAVPAYVERVGRPDELLKLLPEADVVAICVPLTTETENLIDAGAFAAMKPGAYLINIARGRIVNTDALVEALRSGKLAGACLDVTDPEPLPAGHALWSMPNVVITPHMAADAELTQQRHAALLRENLRRFAAGEPLLNVVDKKAGY